MSLGLNGPRLRVAAGVRLGIASRRHDIAREHAVVEDDLHLVGSRARDCRQQQGEDE